MTEKIFPLGSGLRLVWKPNYNPPLVWVEKWKPRSEGWKILAQIEYNEKFRKGLSDFFLETTYYLMKEKIGVPEEFIETLRETAERVEGVEE